MKQNTAKSFFLILIFSLASSPILAATNRSSPIDAINNLNSHKLHNNLNLKPENPQQNSLSKGILITQKQPTSKKKTQPRKLWQRFGFKNRDRKPKAKSKKSGFSVNLN
ncbi:MAG: hypothetical protein HC903_14350 [Methylacidiphilales bacterium]|nr:hypothetical protein [Candidatus Methylacidiphilales bacterium]